MGGEGGDDEVVFDDDWSVFRVTKTMLDTDPVGTFRPIAAKVARNSPHAAKNACDQGSIR